MSDVMDKPATTPISTRKHGDVLIVLSNNPPVNALSTAVRQGLVDAIAEAEADAGVHAVVIACEGQTFFAGADITEFGKPPRDPWLRPGRVARTRAGTAASPRPGRHRAVVVRDLLTAPGPWRVQALRQTVRRGGQCRRAGR